MTKKINDISYLSISHKGGIKSLGKVPITDGGEYSGHGAVVKLVNGHDVQMAREAVSDVVPATTRGTHCSNKELIE